VEAVRSQAQEVLDGQLAAAALVGAQTVQQAQPELYAIAQWVGKVPGAFMFVNDCQQLAVFIAPAGKTAAGVTYYMAGWIDTAHVALVDGTRQMVDLGIDPRKVHTLEDITNALRSRGFVEMTAAAAPTLYAALKLAIGFIRSMGSTISDVIVAPAFTLATPPWCMEHPESCVQVKR
jgi:hypothetical protein